MTTLHGTKRDLTVSIGFFVLVAGAVAISMLVRGSTVPGVVFLVVAIGLVLLAFVLRRRPSTELRITDEAIELTRLERSLGKLTRDATGGNVDIRRQIWRGRTFWTIAPPGPPPDAGIPVDGFMPDEIKAAAEQHGWVATVSE